MACRILYHGQFLRVWKVLYYPIQAWNRRQISDLYVHRSTPKSSKDCNTFNKNIRYYKSIWISEICTNIQIRDGALIILIFNLQLRGICVIICSIFSLLYCNCMRSCKHIKTRKITNKIATGKSELVICRNYIRSIYSKVSLAHNHRGLKRYGYNYGSMLISKLSENTRHTKTTTQ